MHLSTHGSRVRLLSLALVVLGLGPLALPAGAQETLAQGEIDVDFLFNYYQQDGEHSPVTGGIGTEDMDVLSPVILVAWRVDENWTLRSDLGVDAITSASVDAIDDNVSSASRQDARAFLTLSGSRPLGDAGTLTLLGGFSTEYDYQSFMAGAGYARDFNRRNTNLSAQVRFYTDTVELYGIDGVQRGEGDRDLVDLTLGLTQVLGQRTLLSAELYVGAQDGFLSTPFHEVILADGSRVAERLPDSRRRTALGLAVNHSVTDRFVPRVRYRFYDDDWGIQSHSIEFEPHVRLGGLGDGGSWIYPILRWHTQDSSDYFGLPGTFTLDDPFYTADYDLSELTSEKYGLGWHWTRPAGSGATGWTARLRRLQARISWYTRDDGLDAISASFGVGWRF